jgi:hypothetical protein
VGERVAGSGQRESGVERTSRRHYLLLACFGVLLIGGSGWSSPPTSAQTAGVESKLADLEFRLHLAEKHIADLTSQLNASQKSGATASRVKAPFEVVGPNGVVLKVDAIPGGGRLEVKDASGGTVVDIASGSRGGVVSVMDGRGGQGKITLFVGKKGGSGVIVLADARGQNIFDAGVDGEDGLPKVDVLQNGQLRARMEARSDLGVITAFTGEGKGKPAASVGGKVSGEGAAGVRVYNRDGQPIVGMSTDPKKPNAGFLGVADSTGKVKISLLTTSDGAAVNVAGGASNAVSLGVVENRGQLVIFNPAGSPVVHATTNPAGLGEVLVRNGREEVNAFIRDEGADGASCVVRKGKIHCLGIGLPLGPN